MIFGTFLRNYNRFFKKIFLNNFFHNVDRSHLPAINKIVKQNREEI